MTNIRIAPMADPICVTMPHHSNAILPPSLKTVAMLTLENDIKADTMIEAITCVLEKRNKTIIRTYQNNQKALK